jgi:F-type H+-transporting ATPase subunit delta
MQSSIALKYARNLVEVAAEAGREAEVHKELQAFRDVLNSSQELRDTLDNPAIPFVAKRRIIEELALEIPLQKTAVNFVLVVLGNARMNQFERILEAVGSVLDERKGIVQADVFSARKLGNEMRRKLEGSLAELTGGKVRLEFVLDPDLVGGLKVRIGSEIYDGSVRTQLNAIQRELTRE